MDDIQATKDYFKFCPGEERIKISNAICRGRRAIHFPKCCGCQFNDDEQNAPERIAAEKAAREAPTIESMFHLHEVRGVVPVPLSPEAAWRIGHATAQFLKGKLRGMDRANPNTRSVLVGRDMRPHSSTLQEALIDGIRSSGVDVVDIGMIDTPQLAFAIQQIGACGGIQTTGGSATAEYSGFKIFGSKGMPVALDTGLASIRDIASRVPQHQTGTTAKLTRREMADDYKTFIRGFLRSSTELPRIMKIVIDARNGMAGRWIPMLLDGIRRLQITRLNFRHDGIFAAPPHFKDPRYLRELRKTVRESKANLGIAFDGDATCCTFVDDLGVSVPPDIIATLLARYFIEREPGATIVYDARSSRCLADEIERTGGNGLRERVGHPIMKKTMLECGAIFGSDLDGRFYFRGNGFCESPILALAHVLNMLTETDRKLSELVRSIQRYRSSGVMEFRCDDVPATFSRLSEMHPDAETDETDGMTYRYPDWWFNVRHCQASSRLQLVVEARTRKCVDGKLEELSPLLGERL